MLECDYMHASLHASWVAELHAASVSKMCACCGAVQGRAAVLRAEWSFQGRAAVLRAECSVFRTGCPSTQGQDRVQVEQQDASDPQDHACASSWVTVCLLSWWEPVRGFCGKDPVKKTSSM